jgi:hypothetical protein
LANPDFGAGTDNADRAHEEAEPALLDGKDMLDGDRTRARLASPRAMCAGMFLPRGFFRGIAARPRRSSSSRFGASPYIACGVVTIQHRAECRRIDRKKISDFFRGVQLKKDE